MTITTLGGKYCIPPSYTGGGVKIVHIREHGGRRERDRKEERGRKRLMPSS